MSTRPTIWSTVRKPISAMYSRTCSAMKKKKLITCSGCPLNCLRSSGSWVAMPTGQVLRWHFRIMMQPMVTSGMVAKPNSSAPKQGGDDHVAPGLQLAVRLHADAAAQVVQQQHLLGFGESQLPGNAGMLNRAERRRAGAAGVAADQHHVGVRLGHARRHGAHAHFRDQLHGDARLRVDVLQVVDQLGEVFDRVDVVMRRRRDQPHAGIEWRMRAITSSTLWPGSWPPSPGLAPCAILICSSSALTR